MGGRSQGHAHVFSTKVARKFPDRPILTQLGTAAVQLSLVLAAAS